MPIGKRFVAGETQREIARKGAIATNKIKKQKKEMADFVDSILDADAEKRIVESYNKVLGDKAVPPNTIFNFEQVTVMGLVARASKGDLNAFNKLQEIRQANKAKREAAKIEVEFVANKDDKIDFKTFCKNASYPEPFEKQIEFLNFGYAGGFRMVEASRGYGKTDYGAILYPAYQIYLNHSKTFILFGKSRDKAAPAVKEIARSLEANGVELETSSAYRIRVKGHLGKQENFKAMGVKQSIKGNHPDFIICDDVVDIQDKYSKAERNFLRSFYDAISGLVGNVLFLGQPVFYKDLYSQIRSFVKVLSLPHGTIVELDHDLEARRAAGISEEFINANYHLTVSRDEICPFSSLEIVNFYPFTSSFMWIDPSEGKGDYTAVNVMARNFDKVIFAGFCFNKAWFDCDKEISFIYEAYKTTRAGIETNNLGTYPVIVLRKNGLNFGGKNTTKNKTAKIQNAASFKNSIALSSFIPKEKIDDNFYLNLKEANDLFIKQVKEYEYAGTEHDDAPDSIASSLDYLGIIPMERK